MADEKKQSSDEQTVDDDFKYILRLAGSDVDGEKPAFVALTDLSGIGIRISEILIQRLGYPGTKKIGHMSDEDTEKLEEMIENLEEIIPKWLLNRQKDWESGEDIHLFGPELDMTIKDDVNRMRMVRCYRGIRHETGQKVRGQRTRSNGRSGLTLGVSRKRV